MSVEKMLQDPARRGRFLIELCQYGRAVTYDGSHTTDGYTDIGRTAPSCPVFTKCQDTKGGAIAPGTDRLHCKKGGFPVLLERGVEYVHYCE